MWSNGTITDLGTFGLDPAGEAINNRGVIVGPSSLGAWSGGVFQNLNNLIPPGIVHTIQQNEQTQEEDRHEILATTRTGNRCLRCDDACSAGHRDLFGVRQLKLAARRRIHHQSPRLLHHQRETSNLAIDLNGSWSVPINIGASGLPAGVSVASTPVIDGLHDQASI